MNNLLIFPVFFPILAGVIEGLIKFKSRKLRDIYLLVTTIINSSVIVYLVVNGQGFNFKLFQISADLPIRLEIDGMGRIFACLIAVLWPLAISYALEYMVHEGAERMFYAFYLMTYGITTGIAFSGNLITLYLFYEFLTLITMPIVMHGMKKKNVAAGRKYIMYSIGGAAFAFIGIMLLFYYTGSTDFAYGGVFTDEEVMSVGINNLRIVYVMTFLGFGVKSAIFPLHGWLPTASIAPTPVTALLHAVAVVNCGCFAICRSTYFVFGTERLSGSWAQNVVMIMTIITILYGSTMALKEHHFKRRLAYSTISNLSYMLFGVTLMSPAGLTGALSHFVFHGIIKITLFFVAGIVLCKYEKAYVDEIFGMGRKMKITFAAFLVAGLGLMGVPPTIGFISKWKLIEGASASGNVIGYIGMSAILVSAVLTAIYIMSIVIKAYLPGPTFDWKTLEDVKDPGPYMTVPLVILSVLIVFMTAVSPQLIDFISKVSEGII